MDTTLIKLTAHKFDAEKFYNLLFERHPEVRSMFPTDEGMKTQHKLLTKTMSGVVQNIDNFDAVLKPQLILLGRRHKAFYGATRDHFPLVGAVLLDSLELQTQEERDAWSAAYAAISDAMLEGMK